MVTLHSLHQPTHSDNKKVKQNHVMKAHK